MAFLNENSIAFGAQDEAKNFQQSAIAVKIV